MRAKQHQIAKQRAKMIAANEFILEEDEEDSHSSSWTTKVLHLFDRPEIKHEISEPVQEEYGEERESEKGERGTWNGGNDAEGKLGSEMDAGVEFEGEIDAGVELKNEFMGKSKGGINTHWKSTSEIIAEGISTNERNVMMTSKFEIDPKDLVSKYFVFQPSGGWGNQRMLLRWAMRAANAMDRILIVPMVAPHNKMWQGYDRLNASDMVAVDRVLDLDALEAGTVRGIRVWRGHLRDLPKALPGTWKTNLGLRPTTKWLKENAIRAKWRNLDERVVFWQKASMWECCGGGELMTPYIMFNDEFKHISLELAKILFNKDNGDDGDNVFGKYNAVHVRRGGGHTRIDRRSAEHYYDMKLIPNKLLLEMPLYVATDEKNKTWFEHWKTKGYRLSFWADIVKADTQGLSRKFINSYPRSMRNDVIGFIEQLICARANKWTGSDGSTFSFSIGGMRLFKSLVDLDWKDHMDDNAKKVYFNKGKGIELYARGIGGDAIGEKEVMHNVEDGSEQLQPAEDTSENYQDDDLN